MATDNFIKYLRNNGFTIPHDAKKLRELSDELDDFVKNRRYGQYQSRKVIMKEMDSKITALEEELKKGILDAYVGWCILQLTK